MLNQLWKIFLTAIWNFLLNFSHLLKIRCETFSVSKILFHEKYWWSELMNNHVTISNLTRSHALPWIAIFFRLCARNQPYHYCSINDQCKNCQIIPRSRLWFQIISRWLGNFLALQLTDWITFQKWFSCERVVSILKWSITKGKIATEVREVNSNFQIIFCWPGIWENFSALQWTGHSSIRSRQSINIVPLQAREEERRERGFWGSFEIFKQFYIDKSCMNSIITAVKHQIISISYVTI